MKAPPFRYLRAETLADVFRLQREAGPNARLLAGGQTLLATLAFRLSDPDTLIDITRVPELQGITQTADGHIRVGALTTHRALGADPLLRRHVPLLGQAVPLIAHPAIRNRGTIGGSLAYADPAAELPACCVALGATIITAGPTGERRIPAADFFTGLFLTALTDSELIRAVEFPQAAVGDRATIVELARRSGDYAMAGLVAHAAAGAGVRLVYFALGPTPVDARHAAAALGRGPWTPDRIKAAQGALDQDLDPPADQHGGADMKRHLARVLLARTLAGFDPSTKAAAA